MRITFRSYVALAIVVFGCLMAMEPLAATTDDGIFTSLRSNVAIWREQATEQKKLSTSVTQHQITGCATSERPDLSGAIVFIDGTEFQFRNEYDSAGSFCTYLMKPFERPLSVEEARLLFEAIDLQPSENARKRPQSTSVVRKDVGEKQFAALMAYEHTAIHDELLPNPVQYVDCSGDSTSTLLQEQAPQSMGYLYNSVYTWREIDLPSRGGRCILIVEPLGRGLSQEEARYFIDATKRPLPSSSTGTRDDGAGAPAAEPDIGQNEVQSSGPIRLTNPNFPYSAAGVVVHLNGQFPDGSMVQVGPNVFVTAAHVVVGAATVVPNQSIRPAYKNPTATGDIYFDVVWDPDYDRSNPNAVTNMPHDIAILYTRRSVNLSQYPIFFQTQESLDIGFPQQNQYCGGLGTQSDAFFFSINGANSWFYDYPCYGYGTVKQMVGYPAAVNGQGNTGFLPYISNPVELVNYIYNNLYRELYYPCQGCAPVILLNNSYSVVGDSGGPVFGFDFLSSQWRLLGIVGRQVTHSASSDGIAGGDFQYNHAWLTNALNYNPGTAIQITSPQEGAAYDRSLVPNLVATAGTQTSQLRWTSDADGLLGTGGNVAVAGRLSLGVRTITATIGSSGTTGLDQLSGVDTASVFTTLHILVTGTSSATCTPNPSVVLVPATQSTGPFSFSWNIPGYTSLDLQGSINGGPWGTPVVVGPSGSNGSNIPLNDSWAFRFVPHGQTSPVLCTFTVAAVPAPYPIFGLTPAGGLVRVGTSHVGPFSYSWDAPGYQTLDLWGKINDGPWNFGLEVAASGNTGDTIAASVTYQFRFYPHGDTTHIIGALSVTGVIQDPMAFNINPPVVIVQPGQTTGPFGFSWSAPDYAYLDLWGSVNGAPYQFGLSIPNVGSSGDNIPAGSTYRYRFYPPGDSTHILGTLTVSAHY
jgi:hypothetical protein